MTGAASGPVESEPLAFSYHRGIAPMMWVFFGLAGTELVVVHFLLALWRTDIALVVSALTLPLLVWLAAAIASFRRLPVVIGETGLTLRTGRLRCIEVPLQQIAGARADWSSEDLKARGVTDLALIAYPNVLIDLSAPLQTRRGAIHAIAHKLDNAAAFTTALKGLLPAHR